MANRIEKVNSLLGHQISQIILRDFDFQGVLVTLTHVDTTPNLIEARVYISVLVPRRSLGEGGPEEKSEKIVEILNSGVPSIQKKINKLLNMRPIPKITFKKDEKIAEAARIESLLNNLKKPEN